jgi:hypothetical protein
MYRKSSFLIVLTCGATMLCVGSRLDAIVNVANSAPIIGGTNNLEGGAFNSTTSNFSVDNVTDGQNASPNNDTGTITEAFADDSYWLGPQKVGSSIPTTYFVIDLGTPSFITQFDLFNTSNGHARDRGTGQFTIKGSNSVTNVGALGMDLSGTITTLVSGTLLVGNHTATPGQQLIVDQVFLPSSFGYFRYLRFDALTALSPDGSNNGAGLAEMRVYAPEPVGASGMLAIGLAGMSRMPRCRGAQR